MQDINIDNFQYLFDKYIKVDWYLDDYGNIISQQVKDEQHTILQSPTGTQYISLNQIPDIDAPIYVKNKLNTLSSKIVSIKYERVNSLDLLVKSNQFYFDEDNSRIYFTGVTNNQNIVVTYSSIGIARISSNMVYTEYDSNGNILETLEELVRKSKNALNQIITVGSAEKLKLELEAQIKILLDMFNVIKTNIPLAKQLSADLDKKVKEAKATKDVLSQTVTNAQDMVNTIKMSGNNSLQITTTMWGDPQSDGYYHYIWTHTMASIDINITCYEITANGREGSEIQPIIKDNKTIEFVNDTNAESIIIASARAWGGSVASLSAFNADQLSDGIEHRFVSFEEKENIKNIPYIQNKLEEMAISLNQIWLNVKDYGAVGDGVTDDWEAINNAINEIENSGGTIFFPTGVYAISKPIEINNIENATLLHNIVLKGVESNIPYYNSYGENPNKLAMNSNIVPTSDFVGTALLIFGRCANTLVSNIAFIGAKTNQAQRNIKGIVYNSTPIMSNNAIIHCAIFRFTTGVDGYKAPILKIEFTNVQYCKDVGVLVRGDSRIIECEISGCGVSLSGKSNEMSLPSIFQPSGYYGGTGILVVDSAGNTNIIGGLIDWNCKGIVCDAGAGLIVNGTRFHHNAEQHIWIRSRGDSLGACGFNITGCRFLGGGFLIGSLNGKCAIGITNDSTYTAPIYGNISSNVFRVGDWTASENSDVLIANPTATTGNINSTICVYTTCDADLTITGNDMINDSATNGSLGITQNDASKLIKIKFYGNNTRKLGWTTGNVRIYTSLDKARVNGKPTYMGTVDGETTENINTSIYVWNNYVWSISENMWRGINQRNLKYDVTANRPTLSAYVDKGYEYYDTTLGKRITWDGSTWRDYNGTSV